MYSPQWLRVYLAHLGLLWPALDALWQSYQLPEPIRVFKALQQRISNAGYVLQMRYHPNYTVHYNDALDITMYEQAHGISVRMGGGLWRYNKNPTFQERSMLPAAWIDRMLAALIS